MALKDYSGDCDSIEFSEEPTRIILPAGYDTIVVSEEPSKLLLRLNCTCKSQFETWLAAYEEENKQTFRTSRSEQGKGRYLVHKAWLRCQHNTAPRPGSKPHDKNTYCPVTMKVAIRAVAKKSRTKDKYMPDHPTIVEIRDSHNHWINSASVLKYRDPNKLTKERFLELFKSGHSPLEALELHKKDLMEQYEDYFQISVDRSICPDMMWVYKFFYKRFKKEFGSDYNPMEDICQKVQALKSSGIKTDLVKIDSDFGVVILTPLMERIHTLKTSGQVVFFDSTANNDWHNCRIFLLMVDSCLGGLPIGAFVTSSESEVVITAVMKSYLSLLSEESFGGRGIVGPENFITDDCMAEKNSLKHIFPESNLLICTFHVLQASWRWLYDKKHGIVHTDRQELYSQISRLLYSSTDHDFQVELNKMKNGLSKKYPRFLQYVNDLEKRSKCWTLCFRTELNTCGNNNITEMACRVFKDRVVRRKRGFSVSQLIQFISVDMCSYYEHKIINVISGRIDQYLQSSSLLGNMKIDNLQVIHLQDTFYTVTSSYSSEPSYFVDVSIGVCECFVGKSGAPCKHQHAVHVNSTVTVMNMLPMDSNSQRQFYWIATGENTMPQGGFESLSLNSLKKQFCHSSETVSEEVEMTSDTSSHALETVSGTKVAVESFPTKRAMLDDGELKLQMVFNDIMLKFKTNPTEYHAAITAFHKSHSFLRTHSAAVLSALHYYGKVILLPALRKVPNNTLQPTAVSTPETKCLQKDRPIKRPFVPEHGYAAVKDKCPKALC